MWFVLLAAMLVLVASILSIDARLKKQNANTEKVIERLDMIYQLMKKQDDTEIRH